MGPGPKGGRKMNKLNSALNSSAVRFDSQARYYFAGFYSYAYFYFYFYGLGKNKSLAGQEVC